MKLFQIITDKLNRKIKYTLSKKEYEIWYKNLETQKDKSYERIVSFAFIDPDDADLEIPTQETIVTAIKCIAHLQENIKHYAYKIDTLKGVSLGSGGEISIDLTGPDNYALSICVHSDGKIKTLLFHNNKLIATSWKMEARRGENFEIRF